LAVLLTIGVS